MAYNLKPKKAVCPSRLAAFLIYLILYISTFDKPASQIADI